MATLYGRTTPRHLTVVRPAPPSLLTRIRHTLVRLGTNLRAALIAIGEHSQPEPRAFGLPLGRAGTPEQRAALRALSSLRD